MGPCSLHWFKERGLTRNVKKDFNGEIIEYDEIIENYSGGRIDVYGTGDFHNREIGVPIMHDEDWHRFSKWLSNVKTETMLSLYELTSMYEKDNPKIRWWQD